MKDVSRLTPRQGNMEMVTGSPSQGLVDTHCHLDLRQFDHDREEVVVRAEAAGVRILINPGVDLDSCQRALALADRHDGIYAAVGVHPNDCAGFDDRMLAALRKLASHPKVVAIGEIGLDYYWKRVPADQQKQALRAQLALAAELGLPVILHSRESNAELLGEVAQHCESSSTMWGSSTIQAKRGTDGIIGIWHAFSGDLAEANAAYDLGLMLGLGGPVTFQNARKLPPNPPAAMNGVSGGCPAETPLTPAGRPAGLRALVPQLRLDRIVLETDAPYLAPHPYRGQRNEPGYVPLIAQAIAELVGLPVETVAARTTANSLDCFVLAARPGHAAPQKARD